MPLNLYTCFPRPKPGSGICSDYFIGPAELLLARSFHRESIVEVAFLFFYFFGGIARGNLGISNSGAGGSCFSYKWVSGVGVLLLKYSNLLLLFGVFISVCFHIAI